MPYVATALKVSSGVVSRRSAAVCPLLEVVHSKLTLSRACGKFNIPRQHRLLIIICADATPLADLGHQVRHPRDRVVSGGGGCKGRPKLGDVVGA